MRLVLTGSSTVAPLAAELAKRFEAQNPGVRIDVQTGGSSRGIADVQQGVANIGMASRALHESERALFAHTIAYDGICLIINKDNPVQTLSDAQVRDIYTGRITRWSQVGGPDEPIVVVNKAEGRSTLELFLDHHSLKNADIKAGAVIGDNEQGIKLIAKSRYAIGYVSIGTAEYDASHGVSIKLLPVGGVDATKVHVASGEFPLTRPLNFVTRAPPVGLAKRFIDFAGSDQVHDLVEKQYFVPTSP